LNDKKTTGRPFRLFEVQHDQLIEYVKAHSESELGGRLNGSDIKQYIEDDFSIKYDLSSVYKLLHKLGFSWITSRSKRP
jgi:transposase